MLGPSCLSSFPHPRVPPIEIILETQAHGTCCVKILEKQFFVGLIFLTLNICAVSHIHYFTMVLASLLTGTGFKA